MRNYTIILFLFTAALLFSGCSAKLKNPAWVINEVMVLNESSYMDDYGQRNGWIEIYNNTARTQDLGGRYLTNDRNNPKKYPIPRGDVLTRIPPHQHALFWADNEPFNGTFHVSFKLDPTKENYIALYDNDGKTLLDEIVIPAGILADQTYGYTQDGIKYDEEGNILATRLERVTPSSNNAILEENPKVVSLQETDAWGGMLTITSMLVVFFALIALYLFFKSSGNIAKRMSERKVAQSGTLSAVRSHTHLSGEVLAAISAAIHEMREDEHDLESTILTIQHVKRNYSPWSSKLQSLRQLPK
ncbi:OadG family transporter subunit [Proteiniphilum acetatigenes]|uniref:OadG family transporter subunit n=1 Tax=Proteiniphilum acetatigenes TaxID=294710 RepID=UPI000376447F|nr:OadG family transporter subunit [Proteiniphilum acetatigenes]SFL14456.1 Na+-transporting methylmalonyl-CoA/oxaloacetate decarboxylase, gamma subunit [Porphyromonadaceae bacterium KH3CP3RA]